MSRTLMIAALFTTLLATLPAHAQEPLERQMSPQEFQAAGLDKLSPQELESLNAWLGRKISSETGLAAAAAKREVEQNNRGFLNFGSSEPIVAKFIGEFRGFHKGRRYVLDNGQVWQQTDDSTLSVRLNDPVVRITPGRIGQVWYMKVDRYNAFAKVERVE